MHHRNDVADRLHKTHVVLDHDQRVLTLQPREQLEGMRAVSGGTETHLALMDIRSTGVTGKVADERAGAAGIVMNKNSIPYDPEKPGITSGIRVGSPATTTQGMGVEEMKQIASLISRAIKTDDASAHAAIKTEVHALTARFPIYQA